MKKEVEEYMIRFLYKNGSCDTFWFTSFSLDKSQMKFVWTTVDTYRPIHIDWSDVTSIVQLRQRIREVEVEE